MNYCLTPPKQPQALKVSTYLARDLIKNGDVAQIILDDQTYTLRITRAGKFRGLGCLGACGKHWNVYSFAHANCVANA